MFKYTQWHTSIVKHLTFSFKRCPTSVSHVKLYCLRIAKQKNYSALSTKKQQVKPPIQDDVVIYEFNDSKYFLKLSAFSLSNYIIWSLFGMSTYQFLSERPENDASASETFWISDENKRQILKRLVLASFVLGGLLVISVWFYTLRSIKRIILMKETKNVIFETFTPINIVRRFSVPIQDVSGVTSRHKVKGLIPLKIKGKMFYFLVDVNGVFRTPSLFDSFIALKRNLN